MAFNSKIDNDAIGTIKNKGIKCINDNIKDGDYRGINIIKYIWDSW